MKASNVIGCEHEWAKQHGCMWCNDCAAKRAGRKPKPTVEKGWWAISHNMDNPGRVHTVEIQLVGQAVMQPAWLEEVTIVNDSESWRGPAEHVVRLVEVTSKRKKMKR